MSIFDFASMYFGNRVCKFSLRHKDSNIDDWLNSFRIKLNLRLAVMINVT